MIKIPITDLRRQYETLQAEIQPVVQAVLASGIFIKGEPLARFEREMCEYLNVPHAAGVNSGTDALYLALLAAGIGPGDRVITGAMSFLATAEAISLTGAEPVFVDIQSGPDCLNPAGLAAALDEHTKAIIPVHLHGYPCDMDAIMAFATQHKLLVIEDCAQAIGTVYKGQKVGSIGDAGCFSFFPTKNLGCYGDGGMVVTRHNWLAENLKVLREHGSKVKNYQDRLGVNSRLDTLQAAVLSVKLPHLDRWNARRRELAHHYDTLLSGVPVQRPPLEIGPDTYSTFHHYALLVPHRDALQQAMAADGFECLPYYPCPLHRQALYAERYPAGSLPEAERSGRDTLALPLFPELTFPEQETIVQAFKVHLEHLV